ncbi:MAG: hypothetical protein IPK04_17340 [Bdellovibrionales bacterium]|nr:hypothetical protein [Bdellovibrionales bacterium]
MKKNRSIRGGRGNEMHEPPPRKANGIDFVKYLLALGADPNDQSEGRSTIVFETKDSDVRKLLIDNGGKLTTAETFLDAIEKADLKKSR